MTGLYVTVPVTCFRKGAAREYLETEELPPPATCYGFLLSLVGETDRRRHVGFRVTCGLIGTTSRSVVLRTVWRVKRTPLGSPGNTRPDYQQLLSGASAENPFIELIIWLDSSEEPSSAETLELRVAAALDPDRRDRIARFGGLSLGESTHMVDSVSLVSPRLASSLNERVLSAGLRLFLLRNQGRLTLPVWVDHVGSAGTRYEVGDLVAANELRAPLLDELPKIRPHEAIPA